MPRWIVVFRSHVEAPADVHYVDVAASNALSAVREAQLREPPLHEWVLAEAIEWPAGVEDLNEAVGVVA